MTSHYLNQGGLVYWCIYASHGPQWVKLLTTKLHVWEAMTVYVMIILMTTFCVAPNWDESHSVGVAWTWPCIAFILKIDDDTSILCQEWLNNFIMHAQDCFVYNCFSLTHLLWCLVKVMQPNLPINKFNLCHEREELVVWKHFLHYWHLVWEIHRSLVGLPHTVIWSFNVSFIVNLSNVSNKQFVCWWFEIKSLPTQMFV